MNRYESTSIPNPENLEKLKYFADKSLDIRQDFEFVLTPMRKRWRDILTLYSELSSKIGMDRTDEIREKMPEPDKSEFLDLENSLNEFNRRVYEFYGDIIGFLAKDSSIQWEKYSLAPEDSYAGNFSQGYSAKLADNCNVAINWFGYHRKLHSFFNTPEPTEDQKKYLQTQDESYYLVFQDDTHKTIYLNGNDFQLAQRVSDDREFYFPEDVEKSMNKEDLEMFKHNFLTLGQRLKEELGFPAQEGGTE